MSLTRYTPHAFREAVSGLQERLRRQIEAEVSGFPADEAARAERVRRVKDPVTGFRFFVGTYFPHYTKLPPNLLHEHLFGRLPRMLTDAAPGRVGARIVEIAPRGSAKSTVATQLFTLWCVVIGAKRFVIIGMDAYEQAALMLEAMKVELEDNPRLAMDFPEVVGAGRTWREGEIVTRNGVRIQGVGSGQKLRGRRHGPYRPDLVVLDDLENDENVRSKDFRDKQERWIVKAVEPLGPPDGSIDIVMLGTLLHFDAVLARMARRVNWEAHSFRALVTEPARMDLWDAFTELLQSDVDGGAAAHHFYASHQADMDEGAVLFWPAVKPLLALMTKRALEPDAFASEDQNEPVMEGSPFRHLVYWAQVVPEWTKFGAVDPSLGRLGASSGRKTVSRDPSAILIGGFNRITGILDVIEASIRRRLPDVICEDVIAMQREHGCVLWGVEAVQFQEFLRTEIMVRAARSGVALPALPLVPIADKTLRIERLQPPVKAGLIRLHASQTTLREQLQQWPNAAHDDGPDCLEMLWSLAIQHGSGALAAGHIGRIGPNVGRGGATQGYRL